MQTWYIINNKQWATSNEQQTMAVADRIPENNAQQTQNNCQLNFAIIENNWHGWSAEAGSGHSHSHSHRHAWIHHRVQWSYVIIFCSALFLILCRTVDRPLFSHSISILIDLNSINERTFFFLLSTKHSDLTEILCFMCVFL